MIMLWAMQVDAFKDLSINREESAVARASRKLPSVSGSVAVVPLHGVLSQRGEWNGTSTQGFEAAFSRALHSERIGAIVLDVDSPGGLTSGVQLAADRVFAARGRKPIVAVANSDAHSAAYWIASSADVFAAAPGASVGSIGVFREHIDLSAALEQDGVKVSLLATPENKVEGNPYEPLTEEAREHNMEEVRATYDTFKATVARNRDRTAKQVHDGFGRGRSFNAAKAKQLGMIDRVASLPQVMSELRGNQTPSSAGRAELEAELQERFESGEIYHPTTRANARLRLLNAKSALTINRKP